MPSVRAPGHVGALDASRRARRNLQRSALADFDGVAIRVGDGVEVVTIDWSLGIPAWMAGCLGRVVGVGRQRVALEFDGRTTRHHVPPTALRVIRPA